MSVVIPPRELVTVAETNGTLQNVSSMNDVEYNVMISNNYLTQGIIFPYLKVPKNLLVSTLSNIFEGQQSVFAQKEESKSWSADIHAFFNNPVHYM
jgi:hypothetical protein